VLVSQDQVIVDLKELRSCACGCLDFIRGFFEFSRRKGSSRSWPDETVKLFKQYVALLWEEADSALAIYRKDRVEEYVTLAFDPHATGEEYDAHSRAIHWAQMALWDMVQAVRCVQPELSPDCLQIGHSSPRKETLDVSFLTKETIDVARRACCSIDHKRACDLFSEVCREHVLARRQRALDIGIITTPMKSAENAHENAVLEERELSRPETTPDRSSSSRMPVWDSDSRELYVDGKCVKRYVRKAQNQTAILEEFQQQGWPKRIDSPFSKADFERLHQTLKELNSIDGLHFYGDGTGERIGWERTPSSEFA